MIFYAFGMNRRLNVVYDQIPRKKRRKRGDAAVTQNGILPIRHMFPVATQL